MLLYVLIVCALVSTVLAGSTATILNSRVIARGTIEKKQQKKAEALDDLVKQLQQTMQEKK